MRKVFVFIDSDCIVCNKFALFCLNHEARANYQFYFAALESDYAKNFFKEKNYPFSLNSIVFYKNERLFSQSDAIIEIAKCLKFPFSLVCIIQILPRTLRNKLYDMFSKRRHSFGKKEQCTLIPPQWKDRFIV